MDESWDMTFATALDSPSGYGGVRTAMTPGRSTTVARGSRLDRLSQHLPAVTEMPAWQEQSYRHHPHTPDAASSDATEPDAELDAHRTPLSARKTLIAPLASMSSLHMGTPRRAVSGADAGGAGDTETDAWERKRHWDGPATTHPFARSSPASLRSRDGASTTPVSARLRTDSPSYTPSRRSWAAPTPAAASPESASDSTPGVARSILHAPPHSVAALRASRRESSPGLNASLLGGLGGMPLPEESFLGSVGDKTYDELEVAVEDNKRRRSFGMALRAPLPPSPDDTADLLETQAPPSPPRAPRLASSPHRPNRAMPTVRVLDDDEGDGGMPPPPVPIPQSASRLRTTSMRSVQRRASPLRERADLPDCDNYDDTHPPPRITRKPSTSSASTGSSEPHSLRRRVESSSTLSTLSSYGRAGSSTHLGGIRELDGSIRGLDASFRLDRLDRGAAASRLDFREPDLLDAASFRLSPPRSRPSARDIFTRGGDDDGTEYVRSPGATPGRKHASAEPRDATPRRRLAHRSLPPDMAAEMTFDLGQLLKRTARPKRPSGTEESLLMPDRAADALLGELADLSDGDDEVVPVRPPRTPRAAHTALTDEQLDAHDRMHREEQMYEGRARPGLQRTSSTRSTGLQRTSSTRSTGLQRSDSTRDMPRSESNGTGLALTSSRSAVPRSDSTRDVHNEGRDGGLTRTSSTRSARPALQRADSGRAQQPPPSSTSMRRLPPSTSGRSLASMASGAATAATPRVARADRPDVPLTMRRRAHERAASTASAASLALPAAPSSDDRWADAVERDLVPELHRRGMPSSSSTRRLAPSTGAGASFSLTRTTSVRSTTKTSAPPALGGASLGLTRTHSLSSGIRSRADMPRSSLAPPPPRTTARAMPSSSSRTSLAPAPSTTRTSLHAPAPAAAAAPPRSTITRSSSRPSLAPRTQVGIPKSASARTLAPTSGSGIPKSGSRGSIAAHAAAAAPAKVSTTRLPTSGSRHSLLPSATSAARAPALTPGAGVALARTKLSAPPAPGTSPERPAHRRGLSLASATARSSRTAPAPPRAAAVVPATPAGRAPRAAMVPRTNPRRFE